MDTEEQSKTGRADHLKPWQFKPGQSGNLEGRPEGPSLKEWSKSYLKRLNAKERKEFMTGIDKKIVWEMAEGKPDTKTEVKAEVSVNGLKELSDNELINLTTTSEEGTGS